MGDEFEAIRFEKLAHVAIVTLNRPERLNSFNRQMSEELGRAWRMIGADDEIWVSILTAAGERAFCSGTDVREAVEDVTAKDGRQKFAPGRIPASERKVEITAKLNGVYKPVICAINGIITGGGLHLMADSDIVLCSENAQFFDSHVSAGHVSSLDPILLSRRIPYTVVMRMALLGNYERMSAQRAYEVGLVTEVVPLDRLRERALELAHVICKNAPVAVRKSVEATWRGFDHGLTQALEMGTFMYQENWNTRDFVEGNTAFVEKRPAIWANR